MCVKDCVEILFCGSGKRGEDKKDCNKSLPERPNLTLLYSRLCAILKCKAYITLSIMIKTSTLSALKKDIFSISLAAFNVTQVKKRCLNASLSSFLLLITLCLFTVTTNAQNAIVTENALPGNPKSEWDITGAGDLSIQGFATDLSVNKGTTVRFKINVNGAVNYGIKVYRLGYYQNNGARLISNLGTFTGIVQPAPITNSTTGLIDCGNWSESASWAVPSSAVSGIYIAKLTRSDNNGSSHIVFVVRDDSGNSNLLFKTSDATWQAYNVYGGNSLYVGNTSFPSGHAAKVSYNRPFITRNGGGGGGAMEDWVFNAEYPMLRWLERNGFDVSYSTDMDMDRDPTLITPSIHKVLMSVGHDEYWSAGARKKFEDARNAGVNLAFFSGNEVYWKARWENSIDGSNSAHRTLVCYKEGTMGENVCGGKCDPIATTWTGLWRDGCSFSSADGCKPENALTGQISWVDATGPITVGAEFKNLPFWRNTSIATLAAEQSAVLTDGTIGYEWDAYEPGYASSYPPGRVALSNTSLAGKTHELSLYRHSSGALVFGAGTVQWSWGLDGNHDRGNAAPSKDMQQATVNLFADMDVQPGSLQSDLVLAVKITDTHAASTTITFPAQGATVVQGTLVNITGTSMDNSGIIAGVEVSTNGGVTWNQASGTTNWMYAWDPAVPGTVTIKARAIDNNGNIEIPGSVPSANAISVSVTPSTSAVYSIWDASAIPQLITEQDNDAVELGVKFQTTVNGFIQGIRFYKSPTNTGIHIGNLWSRTGTNLGRATFAAESASGWQEVYFTNPIAVTAGTTYVASYHTNMGRYSQDINYFANGGVISTNLRALANGADGPNGVYKYSTSTAFPSSSYQSTNYWVDVVFTTNNGPDITPPTVSEVIPANNATGINIHSIISAIFNEAIDPTSVNSTTIELKDAANSVVPVTVTYDAAARTASITPSSILSTSSVYTLTIKGGTSGTRIKDEAGNYLAANFVSSFTTSAPVIIPPSPNDGSGGAILVISSSINPFSRYTAEILRAEGLNGFAAKDITEVTATDLANYDVVIVGNFPLSVANVTMLTDWTTAGGTLIAFKPDSKLAPLMGITASGGTLLNKYLLVKSSSVAGAGIVNQTIQFHGAADLYTLSSATSIATLYSGASTATTNPAITIRNVGANGGQAIAFTYDLAKSIVFTRQGNPLWEKQKRDGQIDPIRSDDLYYGNASFDPQPDWIDMNKVHIPQADEQQRLLTKIIIQGNADKKPLPRFWFLPKGLKAAVVMTGDDHANGGTVARFNHYKELSTSNTADAVADWTAIRSSSYIYPNTPITNAQLAAFQNDGFEISLHLNTNCNNFTENSLMSDLESQWTSLSSVLPGINPQTTHRTHCLAWSDWSSQPKIEALRGIRLNTTYYYWPGAWINDKPGMFTGSGMPMRFADLEGKMIDSYQLTTQITDESGINISNHIALLLNNATGPLGYYGVFCANMHTDLDISDGSEAIIAAAVAKQIPIISANQMLTWLDGRNNSSFSNMQWQNNKLSFKITAAIGTRNMLAMLPINVKNGTLISINYEGSPIPYTIENIKGIEYAFFDATKGSGTYDGNYNLSNTAPVISNIQTTINTDNTVTIAWTTNTAANSHVDYNIAPNKLTLNVSSPSLVTSHSLTLSGLLAGETYGYRISATDANDNIGTSPVIPDSLTFNLPAGPCVNDVIAADFKLGNATNNVLVSLQGDGGVLLKPVVNEEFSGSTVPSGFTSAIYNNPTGTTVANGSLTVNSTQVYSNVPYGPGSSVEFLATFNSGTFQNIGFTSDQGYNTNPWVTIGQGSSANGNLYARSSGSPSVSLGTNLLGSPHLYKITWNLDNTFNFYVDGTLMATNDVAITVSDPMYIQISDFTANDGRLSVDWLRLSPYANLGTFTSRVFDVGAPKNWGAATWNADVPFGTSLAVFVRKGNSASPDASWTPFTQIDSLGAIVGGSSRYIQYRADLESTSDFTTPVFKDIAISCTGAAAPLLVTVSPISQTVCVGNEVTFTAAFTGSPYPSIQWQVSTNGTSFTDIAGETTLNLTLVPIAAFNNNLYRVVFTNARESITSEAATLTVNTELAITNQPVSLSASALSNPSINITATGSNLNYQWQVSTDQGATFTNILDDVVYAGSVSNTLHFTAVPTSYNGYQYRNIVTGTCTLISNTATLTVTKANQTIVWNTPSAIIYGTPLSSTELNASVSGATGGPAPGALSYSSVLGTVLNAGTYTITATATATPDYNQAVITVNLIVSKKSLTPVVTVSNKVYSGTTGVAIATRTLSGVLTADAGNVSLVNGTAAFTNVNVGTGKTVNVIGLSISGSAVANYILATSTTVTTADITPRTVSVTMAVSGKVYDGTTSATITSQTLGSLISVDVGKVTLSGGSAAFTSRTAGTSRPVTGTGFSLSGVSAPNYILPASITTTATITKLTISGSVTITNKVYSGTTSATIATRSLTGVLAIDNTFVTLSNGTAIFSNANVGTNIPVNVTGLGLSGTSATNYVLASTSASSVGNITPKVLTGAFTAANKVYDGNSTATILTRTLSGVITADVNNVTSSGGTANFSSATVGSTKIVTGTGFTLQGSAAPNYTLSTIATARANITTRPVTVTANSGQTKVVGSANPIYAYSVTSGSVVSGENFTGALTRTAGEAVGSYAILRGTLALTSNYTLTYQGANFTIVAATTVASLSPTNQIFKEKEFLTPAFSDKVLKLTAYPNPFGKHTNVEFTVAEASDRVIVDVYNLYGLKITRLYEGKAEVNQVYKFDYDGSRMSPGIYIVRLTTGSQVKTFKILMNE
ncbi:MAG: Fibronectin type domain protein [Sphingobacteriales bacterium]|nr:Fibronectin type domain protein [Sphingobacteriales bacterium]